MAQYTGAGNFPYWMTITNSGGLANVQAQSENIPVQVGTQYQFDTVVSFPVTWASGMEVFLTWYTATGVSISSSAAVTQVNMTGGTLYEVNSGLQTAPATAAYVVATIQCLGSPATTNPLQVFNATVTDQNNNIVNVNYAFTYTSWPWSAATGSPVIGWAVSPLLSGDSDSLVLDNIIELMGGGQGVQCTVPELLDANGQGPTFRILAPPSLNSAAFGYESSYDLNAPQPTQDVVASMLLDGERPFGDRASNRTISLPVVIFGTQAGGMAQVLAAREYLMSVIDQQTYPLKWTPADTGLPMLFDCFRALPSNPLYGFNYSAGGTATGQTIGRPNYPIAMITLSIQALPYGRSDIDGVQNLSFTSPLSGGISPQTVLPSTLDTFGTVFSPPPIINAPVWASIGFSNPTSVTSSFNVTTTATVPLGNTIVVEVESATNNVTGVTDTGGNTYALAGVQSTGGACYQFLFTAPVTTALSSGTITVTVGSSGGNYSAVSYKINGAFTPKVLFQGNGTAATYSQALNVSQYTMVLSVQSGLGGSGNIPTGFTSLGANFGNGFNNLMNWYSQPLNQNTLSYAVTGMPNPYALMIFAFVPVNQYWNQDSNSVPSTFIGKSVHYSPPTPIKTPYPAATYTQQLPAAVSIVGCPILSLMFGQSYDTQWPKDPKFTSNNVFSFTLTDTAGHTLSFSKTQKKVAYGTNPTVPKWTAVNASIPQGKNFRYDAVTAYTVRVTNWQASGHTGYIRMHCWLNDLVANPQTIQNPVSPRGSVYQLFGLPGSARSPISVQCQLPAAQNITKEITSPASGTWIVPPGVYSVQAEAWAGGGAGAAANLSRQLVGGGGGGAEYAQEPALNVLPGQQVPWAIGQGGTPGQIVPTVVQYTKGGLGHWTCPANVTTILAETWGAGGAGGAGAGGGGGGEYAAVNVPVTPGKTYTVWTGAGGRADTGTSAAQIAARQGATSWFGAPGNAAYTSAYVQSAGGSTSLTGNSSGGLGGKYNTIVPSNFTRTSFALPSGNVTKATMPAQTSSALVAAGNCSLVIVQVSAAATVTVSDSSGNVYLPIGNASNTGTFVYVFACFGAKAVSARGTITVNQSVSQHLMALGYNVPGVVGVDAAFTASSGTGTTASVTSGTGNFTNDAIFAIIGSVTNQLNSAGTGGFTYGPASTNSNVSPVLQVGVGENVATTTAGLTSAPTFGSSTVWCGIALSFIAVKRYAGGRGGTSPGPSGGGGGGAAGATGVGGTGGNSQPFTVSGHWQAGGAGGTGTGSGGNGGAGANTPGFPGVGAAPGGGGGGGYQTQPLFNPASPSNAKPGQQQTNFLGGDGGTGMVQLTYQVGSGSPVNGGNTTFGSVALTGTIVTAHGGISAANNSAAGAAGGTGSSNTIHSNGGAGGIVQTAALGSYMISPEQGFFTLLSNGSYVTAANTTGTSAASVAQGAAVAIIESAAEVTDLQVTDSAGNVYQLQGINTVQAGGAGAAGYVYVAPVEFPITTATTLTITSATAQQYGYLWYASPWLSPDVTSGNSGSNRGTSSAFTGQFGIADTQSVQLEVGVVLMDSSRTVSAYTNQKTIYNAASTATQAAGTLNMAAVVLLNQGGGTGAAASGDVISGTLSGSANWAVLCVPFTVINQQANLIRMDWRTGTTPGAQTTWAFSNSISNNGMLVVAGMAGSGASITAGPTAMADGAGNVYTFQNTTIIPASGGVAWIATAPVTAAVSAGTTGTINWGHASAAPNYTFNALWAPNASGVDAAGVVSVTGNSSAVSAGYAPSAVNDMVVAYSTALGAGVSWSNWASQYNWIDFVDQSYLRNELYATQAVDLVATPFTASIAPSSPWAALMLGLKMNLAGTGGGAAGGANGAGYPGVWQYGGPGYTGGGKGGAGAASPPQAGNGASYPGGGGGGCLQASGTAQEGGQGAPGAIRLTWAPPIQPMNSLIVHSLSAHSDPNVNPITPIPITDVPNNTEYAVPSLTGILPATFNSTYTIMLAAFAWNSITSSTPRQITVTINQYEFPGGPKYSAQVSKAVIPATDSVNGLLSMGEVTLPVKDYLRYNDQSYFTVSINDTDTSDRFMDVLMLDTLGQTWLVNIDPGQAGYGQYVNFFLDEATSDRDLGFVGASMQDRQHQVSVLDYSQLSGPGMYVGPGDNLFMVYSTSGAPSLSVQYAPRWYLDRMV